MNDKLLERMARAAGCPDLVDILAERLSVSDLQSLLLEIYARRVRKITPAGLLQAYRVNRFVRPSIVDPAVFAAFDIKAFSLLPTGFEAVELSPLCPLGTCAAVAPVNQNNIVGALRATELVADATNVLALECALRRKDLRNRGGDLRGAVRLAASHRHVRAQSISDEKYTAHFKVFCLATAGRDTGGLAFEIENAREHLDFYIRLLYEVVDFKDPAAGRVEVFLTDLSGKNADVLQKQVLDALADRYPGAAFALDPGRRAGIGYYTGLCFNIRIAGRKSGTYDNLVDGGLADWTQKLLADNKERFLASGIGSELFQKI